MRLREAKKMQRMPKYVWWIIGMLVVLGYLFWVSSYTREVGGEWVGLQKSLIGLDSVIQGAIREDGSLAIDFQDLENSCAGLESIITKLEKQFKRKMVPPGFGGFNSNFVDYLGSSKAAVESVNKNCSTWSKIEMKDLKKKIGSMGDTQLDCVNCWRGIRGLQMREDLFALTPAILNQMHAIKSKPKLPDTGSSSGGSRFAMPTDPYLASYVSQMQLLLREYKSLRGGLDRYIDYVKRTGQSIEGSAYTVEFDRVIAARQSILDRVNMISPPIQYLSHHQEAAACIEYGISAMCALKRGDYPSFHNMSEQNTPRLARIRRIYGY